MTSEERCSILEDAYEVFFKAMMSGYAGNSNRAVKTTTNNGCTKKVEYTEGDYTVTDTWHTHPESDKSSGSTLITFQGIPIWWMAYSGNYPKEVIPFLKEALRETYGKNNFIGGRGPTDFVKDQYWYKNCPRLSPGGDFTEFCDFAGSEAIYRNTNFEGPGEMIGYHHYHGQSLI